MWGECDSKTYFKTHSNIEVRSSQLGGDGVFVKTGEVLKKGSWVSWYPGLLVPLQVYDERGDYGLQVMMFY